MNDIFDNELGDDRARRAMALVKAALNEDPEAYRLLGPGRPVALERLERLDTFGALSVESDEVEARELVRNLVALTILVAEETGMGRDWLRDSLDHWLSPEE
jgi:hypothetical protein